MYIVTRLVSDVHFHITGPKLTFKTYNYRHCDTSMSLKTADYFPSGGVINSSIYTNGTKKLWDFKIAADSTHCHDGAFSWSIKFSVHQFSFCTECIEWFCMAPLGYGGRRKRPAKFFWWSWFGIQSINQSTKLNWILISFQLEIVALMPSVYYLSLLYAWLKMTFLSHNVTTWYALTYALTTGAFK